MIFITNRIVDSEAKGLDVFGKKPNQEGANELRAVEVAKRGSSWTTEVIPDKLSESDQKRLGIGKADIEDLELDASGGELPGSCYAVISLLKRLNAKPRNRRNILIYVHGYNNNVEAIAESVNSLEKTYDLVCLPFTWPANGGGRSISRKVMGLASYLSDKQDATLSQSALNRFLVRMHEYMEL